MPASADGLRERFATQAAYAMEVGTDRTVAEMQQRAPRRTFELYNAIAAPPAEAVDGPERYRQVIRAAVDYASYQDEGTGIYGPSGEPITARFGRFLVFYWPAAGKTIFARQVQGTTATHFFSLPEERWLDEVRAAWAAAA